MSEDKKEFKVNDRRHFTPEGEVRGSAEEGRVPPEPSIPETRPPASSPSSPPPPGPSAGATQSPEPPEGGGLPADLTSLFVSLAAQASYLLGDASSEEGGPQGPDLEGVRSIISLLEVLKAKTEGNRTPEEDGILDRILYELRMAYVRSKKGA
jgi:uncharacterized protein DUF1844